MFKFAGLGDLERTVDRLAVKHGNAQEAVRREQKMLEVAESNVEATVAAQEAVQHIAREIQQQAHQRIASVVTRCLQTIFDDSYELKIDFERKRGKTEARISFVKNGLEVDPLTASGGGVVDVAAFALRLACLSMSRPPLRRVVLLDEPFRFVSAEYRRRIRMLLEMLAKEMGIQFVMVTHFQDLRMGEVIEL